MTRAFLGFVRAWPLCAIVLSLALVGASCTGSTTPGPCKSINQLPPGEQCAAAEDENCVPLPPDPELVKARFAPSVIVMAPGQTRQAHVTVDPDFCQVPPAHPPTVVTFASSDPSVVTTPDDDIIHYGKATIDLTLRGDAVGATTITVFVPTRDPEVKVEATVEVQVLPATLATWDSAKDVPLTTVAAGSKLEHDESLGASIALPATADRPNDNGFQWSVQPFEAAIAFAEDIVPPGYIALGPAIRFDPSERTFPRDLPLSIPVNPALMPDKARGRHMRVAYQSPGFATPRTFPATDPTIVRLGDCDDMVIMSCTEDDECLAGQVCDTGKCSGVPIECRFNRLSFKAPALGTYQAVVAATAGQKVRTRRITHRALIGVSMGGAGAAQFGMRHHHLFDVVAPMGGPVDWTWLIDHLENNHLAGFRPIAPGTVLADIQLTKTACTTDGECQSDERCIGLACTLMPATDEPYEHASTFNTWWYEFPGQGHGGSFDREEYLQIFRDLTLMYGNPMGYNPLALNLPAGVDPTHPAQIGDSGDCGVYVKPIDGDPNEDAQSDKFSRCPAERCKHVQVLDNYYDDEFNPDGTFPVITFCDGAPQDASKTPWANTWHDRGNNFPMEVALAVDYNGNGVRDELEPVIKAGHERWDDWGEDATPSVLEPGYGPDNLDPSGDDYHPRFNPGGTEDDHRWQTGEPFDDHGLDGVDGTAASPYDFGEDDNAFTVAPGLQRFWDVDAHSMVRGWSPLVSTPLTDDALARIDFWTDGGNRDLFNFAVAADHFTGGLTMRGRDSVYYSDVTFMPGLDPAYPDNFNPAHVVWEDVQGVVNYRYGKDEPDSEDIDNGSGQHAGTIPELAKRIQAALYFASSRWPDAPRQQFEPAIEKPVGDETNCEVKGNCTFVYTSSDGRTGPVGVTLPPGYGHADLQHVRYPVVYLLHGYGMTPEDLQLAIVFLANWMNGNTDSQASRLAKAIIVYVDGRCREGDNGAECIRGTFFADSLRPDGPQMDNWFLEVMDEVDRRYRTMGETNIEWTD